MARTSGALLLPHVSQFDVDFVIPRVGVDIPVWLDPFLLYKSRDHNSVTCMSNSCDQAEALIARLAAIPPGREAARDYQFLVLEILNYLFNPDLTDGQPEVRTFDGTERRDIAFTNESDEAFWDCVRTSHDNIFVMFER